jgi:hypothetical protein
MMLAGLFGGITMKLFFMGRVALLKEVEISFQREIQFYLASGQALFENGPQKPGYAISHGFFSIISFSPTYGLVNLYILSYYY